MRRVDGVTVTRLTLGDLLACQRASRAEQARTMRGQKSAEAIVAASHRREGPNTRSHPLQCVRCARQTQTRGLRCLHGPQKARRGTAGRESTVRQTRPAREDSGGNEALTLIEQVVRRENLVAAHARVVHNGGAPGVDGMSVDDLMPYCRQHWARIREQLLSGTYIPQPVRRVEIPKPDGKGTRTLGIPTVLDRFIQQALLQVLSPIFDPTFSDASFGFRPGRSTHQAVRVRPRAHRGGSSLGGGRGPREILRPGEPRRADGARGAPGEGQTSAAPDSPLFAGGDDGGRAGVAAHGGYAARRAALPTPQ